jgi:Leucine-rich repeat (LRR) protein
MGNHPSTGSTEHIELCGRELTQVPKQVLKLKTAKTLDLSNNKLTLIPSWLSISCSFIMIDKLTQLTLLDISNNAINQFPTDLPPSLIEIRAGTLLTHNH